MDSVPVMTLQGVGKAYGSRVVLSDVSLPIGQGDSVALRGGNGSGKTTLLRVVAGVIPFHSGRRLLKHPNIKIGYAPDRLPGLRMTSMQYLTHMGRISNVPDRHLRERIEELHTLLHLEQNRSLSMTRFSKGMLPHLPDSPGNTGGGGSGGFPRPVRRLLRVRMFVGPGSPSPFCGPVSGHFLDDRRGGGVAVYGDAERLPRCFAGIDR